MYREKMSKVYIYKFVFIVNFALYCHVEHNLRSNQIMKDINGSQLCIEVETIES